MTTPVDFTTAKLLKEKGFDEQWNIHMYTPTIAEVVMWLYEKHEIWISVVRNDTKDLFNYVITWHNGICENESRGKGYQIPTEAYEAAIKYTLENIIKQ